MHIEKYNQVGNPLMVALCEIGHRFNRSINAPFGLGRRVCKNCDKELSHILKAKTNYAITARGS